MKNRIYILGATLALTALISPFGSLRAQLNVELLHQLVKHSKDESSRQITARNKQATVSAQETVNKNKTNELKMQYRALQSRFTTLSEALGVLSLGIESAAIIRDIAGQQQRIVDLARERPDLVLIAIDAQQQIVPKASMLARFLLGLFISAGDLNQMKASDRRILYTHALNELRSIAATIRSLARSMESATYNNKRNEAYFSDFKNIDITIVEQLLRGHDE